MCNLLNWHWKLLTLFKVSKMMCGRRDYHLIGQDVSSIIKNSLLVASKLIEMNMNLLSISELVMTAKENWNKVIPLKDQLNERENHTEELHLLDQIKILCWAFIPAATSLVTHRRRNSNQFKKHLNHSARKYTQTVSHWTSLRTQWQMASSLNWI